MVTLVKREHVSCPSAVDAALAGADAAFINVPGALDRARHAANAIDGAYGSSQHVSASLSSLHAYVAATKRAGTKSVVIVSVSTVGRDDVFGRQFAEVESKARAADIPFTVLRLPFFLDNIWGNAASIKGQSKIYNSIAPEAA